MGDGKKLNISGSLGMRFGRLLLGSRSFRGEQAGLKNMAMCREADPLGSGLHEITVYLRGCTHELF